MFCIFYVAYDIFDLFYLFNQLYTLIFCIIFNLSILMFNNQATQV